MLWGSEADSYLPEVLPPASLPALGAWRCGAAWWEQAAKHQFLLVAVLGSKTQERVWRASPAQGPAQIRAKSTEQKSSLLFIAIYIHLDERVQSFKEKKAARDMKYSTGVAIDTKLFRQCVLVCRRIT